MTLSDLIQKNSDRQAEAQWKRNKQRILLWLASIKEIDQSIIQDVLNRCRTDQETRTYFIQRAEHIDNG